MPNRQDNNPFLCGTKRKAGATPPAAIDGTLPTSQRSHEFFLFRMKEVIPLAVRVRPHSMGALFLSAKIFVPRET